MNRYTSLFVLLLFTSIVAKAQEEEPKPQKIFTVTVSSRNITIDDKIEVVYTYTGDDFKSITPPEIEDFKIVRPPVTRTYTSYNKEKNTEYRETIHSLTYVLKPTSIGTLTVPSATAKNMNWKAYKTQPININVKAADTTRPRQYTSTVKTLYDNYSDLVIALNNATGPYLVSTGIVYADNSKPGLGDASLKVDLFAKMATGITKQLTRCTDLGTYYWQNIPRKYLCVYDTTGIRQRFNMPHAKDDDGMIVITNIIPAKKWNVFDELQQLCTKRAVYTAMAAIACPPPAKGHPDKKIEVTIEMKFRKVEDMRYFITQAGHIGYTITDSSFRKYGNIMGEDLFSLKVARTIPRTRHAIASYTEELLQAMDKTNAVYINSTNKEL